MLRRLADYHGVPVLAVHAPCLLITQRVWGREPWAKLTKASRRGREARREGRRGAPAVPVAARLRQGLRGRPDQDAQAETDVKFAVENLYPLRARSAEVAAYAPHWNPVELDVPARHARPVAHRGVRFRRAGMADELGAAPGPRAPGRRHQARACPTSTWSPAGAPSRARSCSRGWARTATPGIVVVEISTRRAQSQQERNADLEESLAFAREHLRAAEHRGVGDRRLGIVSLQNQRDRAVVDQRDLPCPRRTCRSARVAPSERSASANAVTSGSATCPRRRRLPGRPPALPGLGVQGELADHQQRCPGVRARLLAVQYPQVVDLAGEGGRGLRGVVVGDADQDHQAGAGQRADHLPRLPIRSPHWHAGPQLAREGILRR